MSEPTTEFVSIPRPAIHTGPKHLTVDEATVEYLLEAATRVVNNCYWGSGVSALVARTLTDAAVVIQNDMPIQQPGVREPLEDACPLSKASCDPLANRCDGECDRG